MINKIALMKVKMMIAIIKIFKEREKILRNKAWNRKQLIKIKNKNKIYYNNFRNLNIYLIYIKRFQ